MLKSHEALLLLTLYREEFLDDKRKINANELVPLLSKALGRSSLRLFRVTTHASVDSAVSEKKQKACDALVESLVEATEEPANKRKKSLLVRFNDEEHLVGDVPAGREEVEFFDFEVGDNHIHFMQDESDEGGASVLCEVLAIAEAHDHEGAAARHRPLPTPPRCPAGRISTRHRPGPCPRRLRRRRPLSESDRR